MKANSTKSDHSNTIRTIVFVLLLGCLLSMFCCYKQGPSEFRQRITPAERKQSLSSPERSKQFLRQETNKQDSQTEQREINKRQPVSVQGAEVRETVTQSTETAADDRERNKRITKEQFFLSQENLTEFISKTYKGAGRQEVAEIIEKSYETGRELNIDPILILSIIAAESSFNRKAVSRTDDVGLMQVSLKVHRKRFNAHGGVNKAKDISVGILVGSQIFKEYLDKGKSVENALKLYVGAGIKGNDKGYSAKVRRMRKSLQAAAEGRNEEAKKTMNDKTINQFPTEMSADFSVCGIYEHNARINKASRS